MKKAPSSQILDIYTSVLTRLRAEQQKDPRDAGAELNISAYSHILDDLRRKYDLGLSAPVTS